MFDGDIGDGIPGVMHANEKKDKRVDRNYDDCALRVPANQDGGGKQHHVREKRNQDIPNPVF